MSASILEGASFTLWAGATTGNFLTALALFLGAGGMALGILGSLGSVSTMLQILSAPLVAGVRRRRDFMAFFSALQRFGAALAGLLALALHPSREALVLFVGLQVLAWACMAPSTVVWQGYMTDLVPLEVRGRYFGKRNAWGGLVGVAAVLAYGWLLDRWPGTAGFRLLYLAALLWAAVNLVAWLLHPEIPGGEERAHRPFWHSVGVPLTADGPHRPVAAFFAAWAFAQGLAVPFFPVVLVRELGLSFSAVSVLATVASVTSLATAGYWGRLQDRIGEPRAIARLTAVLAGAPLLLLAGEGGGWPLLLAAYLLHGAGSSGLGLANQTLIMRLVPCQDRGSYFAFFAASAGLAGFLAPVVAGPLTQDHLQALLLTSGALSLALSLLWHRQVRLTLEQSGRGIAMTR